MQVNGLAGAVLFGDGVVDRLDEAIGGDELLEACAGGSGGLLHATSIKTSARSAPLTEALTPI